MKIVLSCPMYNEIDHVKMQLDDALEMNFDDIVILDDGSTDGTWDILQEYSDKNNHVHVFKNDENSLRSKGINRWLVLAQECLKYDPDWVCIRAADMLYSLNLKRDLRERIKQLDRQGAVRISFPVAHLWRSYCWHRVDRDWATGFFIDSPSGLNMGYMNLAWKTDSEFYFSDREKRAIDHNGAHIPWLYGVNKILSTRINSGIQKINNINKYIVLHYAYTSQDKFISKFINMMDKSNKSSTVWYGDSIKNPGSVDMPYVSDWPKFNGYKAFYEFDMRLNKLSQTWVDYDVLKEKEPMPQSLYSVIKEYNETRAEEYKVLYDEYFGDRV